MTAVGMETVSSPQTIWTKKRLRRGGLSEAYLVAIAIRKDGTGVGEKKHSSYTSAVPCYLPYFQS